MSKNLKLLLLALILVFAGFGLFYSQQIPTKAPEEASKGQATLIIDYGDGQKVTSAFTPLPGQTVFDALKATAEEKNITIEIQQYDFGVFVKSIGGYESSAEMAWIYFVNGASGVVAADQAQVAAGELIEWRYIKPQ